MKRDDNRIVGTKNTGIKTLFLISFLLLFFPQLISAEVIGPGSVTITTNTTYTGLEVKGNGALTVNAGVTLTVNGDAEFANGSLVTILGRLVITGDFVNKNNSDEVIVNGEFHVGGSSNLGNGSNIGGSGSFTSTGGVTGAGDVFGDPPSPCTENCTYSDADNCTFSNTIQTAQEINSGQTPAQLTSTAGWTPPASPVYLWEHLPNGSNDWVTAPGTSNQANYSPPALTVTTLYHRKVTSGSCSNVSNGITITVTANPLPVELSGFTANQENGSVILKWTILSERNNDYFTVERSIDNSEFVEIGTIKSKGNSTEKSTYSLTDENPIPGLLYYRLKQTDRDGKFSYLPVISFKYSDTETLVSDIYPIPFEGELNLNLFSKTSSLINLRIYNHLGMVVFTENILPEIETSPKKTIDLNHLPKGVYYISLEQDGKKYSSKLVKKYLN